MGRFTSPAPVDKELIRIAAEDLLYLREERGDKITIEAVAGGK